MCVCVYVHVCDKGYIGVCIIMYMYVMMGRCMYDCVYAYVYMYVMMGRCMYNYVHGGCMYVHVCDDG